MLGMEDVLYLFTYVLLCQSFCDSHSKLLKNYLFHGVFAHSPREHV